MVEIIFIRHGKTRGNGERRYVGRTDEPLSQNGRKEITALHDSGILPAADRIFVSPMKRCIETAEILYLGQAFYPVDDFREIDFGDYEGKNADELLADPGSGYQAWIDSGGTMPFPHGEARNQFILRCRRGFDEMMDSCEQSLRVVAVVHGGTIMSILSGLCGGDYYDYMCRNGEGFRLRVYQNGDGWKAAGRPERILLPAD